MSKCICFRAPIRPMLIALLLLAGSSILYGAEKHPFRFDDYSALHRARALAVAPDGKTVLFVVSFNGDKGPTKREWHLIEMTGENNRKLELPESFEPAGFTRDGKALYGSYEVEKKQQIGIVPLGSGKATQIIALPNGIRATIISPDGNRFAFAADPRPVDPLVEVRHVAERRNRVCMSWE